MVVVPARRKATYVSVTLLLLSVAALIAVRDATIPLVTFAVWIPIAAWIRWRTSHSAAAVQLPDLPLPQVEPRLQTVFSVIPLALVVGAFVVLGAVYYRVIAGAGGGVAAGTALTDLYGVFRLRRFEIRSGSSYFLDIARPRFLSQPRRRWFLWPRQPV